MHSHTTTEYTWEKVIIFDFWWQFTQNIAKVVRQLGVYSEIVPFNADVAYSENILWIILSGSPCSVNQEWAPTIELSPWKGVVPILGICYGAQYIAHSEGSVVSSATHRQYGVAPVHATVETPLFSDIPDQSDMLMSHGDTITSLSRNIQAIATSGDALAAYRYTWYEQTPIYGVQFHPEVHHSTFGKQLLSNFLFGICGYAPDSWTPHSFVEHSIAHIKAQLGDDTCIMAISWWVDSTVAATLIHKAIGDKLTCFFVDNGLLRKNEYAQVLESYKEIWLHVIGIDAKQRFYDALAWITDPEKKRKTIWSLFIDIFQEEAAKLENIRRLWQWTIYPDVIESVSVMWPSVTIKSHHNVWGLPEHMHMELIEPLRYLFKDDVRRVGADLGIPQTILWRHPFPGPGLAIRIVWSDITAEKVAMLQEADHIFIKGLKDTLDDEGKPLYNHVRQAGAMLLPVQSVWVMWDERTYEQVVSLRAVHSVDGMTAHAVELPYSFLTKISKDIIAKVKGINRVVYDISDKPPATIEWE